MLMIIVNHKQGPICGLQPSGLDTSNQVITAMRLWGKYNRKTTKSERQGYFPGNSGVRGKTWGLKRLG